MSDNGLELFYIIKNNTSGNLKIKASDPDNNIFTYTSNPNYDDNQYIKLQSNTSTNVYIKAQLNVSISHNIKGKDNSMSFNIDNNKISIVPANNGRYIIEKNNVPVSACSEESDINDVFVYNNNKYSRNNKTLKYSITSFNRNK